MTYSMATALALIQQKIRQAECMAQRSPNGVRLIAVSKSFSAQHIRLAWQAGQHAFAESYAQELFAKQLKLLDLPIEWHFIGPIQSNKTAMLSGAVHWVHSLDRLKIAERLSRQRPAHLPALNVCIQLNISGESNKSGCTSDALFDLAQCVCSLPHLKLRGLMGIAAATENKDRLLAQFLSLKNLFDGLNQSGFSLDSLSMGMSADFEWAIQAGSTMVRIGQALFGERAKTPVV